MANTINRASTIYTSPNDLGYVGLPREAVLNNTVSPAEKRAFATIAAIPLVIPAALFATEATLLAGLLALVGCGSPGEAEDPILTSFSDVGHGEISPDAGTTDEGDGLVATDDGMTDTGDTLVAADDGGMSGPDEGVTIADVVEPQDMENDGDVLATADDGTTVVDVLSPPEDGVQDLSDASEVKDEPDVVDSGDGLNATDDGAPIVDVAIPSDVAPPEDGVQDLSDASEVKDVPDVVDSGDELGAADDEVADSSDVAPPLDGSADQVETAVGTDATADSSQPCSPSCNPAAETVTCDEGNTNVAVNYFVKCATQFVCDGIGTSLVSLNLPDPTTQTTQSVTVDKCVSDILFGGCQAINGELSEYCGAVKIEMKPKPNIPPTVNQLIGPADKSLGILPGGDQCFNAANNLAFSFTASDKDNDALTCGLKIYQNGILVPAATVSATFNDLTKPLMLQLSASLLQPRIDYCWNVSCNDGKGGVTVGVGDACFTTSEKGLIGWWRFNEGQGNVVKDSSGNGAEAKLTDFDLPGTWGVDPITNKKFVMFDGIKSYVQINSPSVWNNIISLAIVMTLRSKNPIATNEILADKLGDSPDFRWLLALNNGYLGFSACGPCNWAQQFATGKPQFTSNTWHTAMGVFENSTNYLYLDNVLIDSKPSSGPTVKTSAGFQLGANSTGGGFFSGDMDELLLYNKNPKTNCK